MVYIFVGVGEGKECIIVMLVIRNSWILCMRNVSNIFH